MKSVMRGVVGVMSISLALGLASCANPSTGSSDSQQTDPESETVSASGAKSAEVEALEIEPNSEVADLVPEDYRERGSFTVGINPGVAPLKYVEDGVDVGLVPDLLFSAADVMDLEMEVHRGTFDAMIPGLEADRFHVIGSLNDLKERQETIDFIDYLETGTAILTAADSDLDDITREDMCGMTIGYVRGNTQQSMITETSEACETAGEEPINGVGYGDSAAAMLAIRSGQEDAFWGDIQAMEYNAQESPEYYKIVFEELGGPYGIALRKEDAEFRDALRAALLHLEEEGIYDQLLERWGQSELGMPEFPLNTGP